MSESNSIFIKGARVNNLKNIDVEIPRDKLVVMNRAVGEWKSVDWRSIPFMRRDRRRYVESLSAYARQFLGG